MKNSKKNVRDRKKSTSRDRTKRRNKNKNVKTNSRKLSSSSSSFYSDSNSLNSSSLSPSRSPSSDSSSSSSTAKRNNRGTRRNQKENKKNKGRKKNGKIKEETIEMKTYENINIHSTNQEANQNQNQNENDTTPKIDRSTKEVELNPDYINSDVYVPNLEQQNINSEAPFEGIELRSRMIPTDNNSTALEIYTPFQKINHLEIPNVHRKLIIHNLPPTANQDEIKQYFLTILTTLNPNMKLVNPILSLERSQIKLNNPSDNNFTRETNVCYYIIELATKDDIEILKAMNNTEWRNYRMKIEKPATFFREYNSTQGKNLELKEAKTNIQESILNESDNKLYMGGIPTNAKEHEIREIVESFGQLKSFKLVKDPNSEEDINRGFCFFEYDDDRVADRAIKGLNNREMGEKRLKVQRANINSKSFSIARQLKENPVDMTPREFGKSNFTDTNPIEEELSGDQTRINLNNIKIEIPQYAYNPSRVMQLLNMITAEDIMEDADYREISEDIRTECMQFGTVLNVEIPRPDKSTWIASPAVGKIFVKFSTIPSAKRARYNLSGRKFNRRTVIASFYPENYFDVREFNYHG